MRRLILTVGMLLMGLALIGGSAAELVGGSSLSALNDQVGTHASAAAAVLGLGLIAAAINPVASLGWVRAGVLYGFVVLAFESGSYFLRHSPFHIGPVFFGLAFSLLLIATYPQRKQLIPPGRGRPAAPADPPEDEPATESDAATH